jgi:hypothetical protein
MKTKAITVKALNEALEIAIQDLLDAQISTQDSDRGCMICRLDSSPLCAAVRGEPTQERCFNALKKQLIALGIRDSLSRGKQK